MTLLRVDGLGVTRSGRSVLQDISFAVEPDEIIGIIGPNGAGKTTLLRASLGLQPASGRSSIADMPPEERARRVAWLPQAREIAWPVIVETVVALGRLPHVPRGSRMGETDAHAVGAALAAMGLGDMAKRTATALSGGEQARVLIARTLAQEAPLLLADEPIAGLDPAHQLATMKVFADLAASGHGVVLALHDLNLAARFCSRLLLLDGGRIVADGPPEAVLTEKNVADVFRIKGAFLPVGNGRQFHVLETL